VWASVTLLHRRWYLPKPRVRKEAPAHGLVTRQVSPFLSPLVSVPHGWTVRDRGHSNMQAINGSPRRRRAPQRMTGGLGARQVGPGGGGMATNSVSHSVRKTVCRSCYASPAATGVSADTQTVAQDATRKGSPVPGKGDDRDSPSQRGRAAVHCPGILDRHATSSVDGTCVQCGVLAPCHRRETAMAFFFRSSRLPRRVPWATRPELVGARRIGADLTRSRVGVR
jgi:hypothetical protein